MAILGNLHEHNRQYLKVLVSALENRFGTGRQAELSPVKLKTRVKRRDETLLELSSDIQRLSKLAYADATSELNNIVYMLIIDTLVDI